MYVLKSVTFDSRVIYRTHVTYMHILYFLEKFKTFLTSNYRKHVMEILSADVTCAHYSIPVE